MPATARKHRRATHVLVVAPRYAGLILAGLKTFESRLSITRREPYRRVSTGDVLHIRAGGRYVATARAGRVEHFEGLTPARVRDLQGRFEPAVQGGSAYWQSRRHARYATMIQLLAPRRCERGPAIAPLNGAGWRVVSPA
jgi:hypothetical protein